ncbi:MAG: BMP family ABC transporter substrate-binding protein [Anaerovoracaceae bacterium]|nr:BMP family ABC transporter substrate-binding protein [Bacillota bacterium]MDY3954430.1 BMP family ABC transporter substrate-binding protein [Anaerovoracaceae bacterium]
MKKVIAILLMLTMVFSFAACGGDDADNAGSDLKIGVILVGDENEGYTYAHMEGIKTAAKNLGIADDQIIWKYSVAEDESCFDAAADLADAGCTAIFSNSYGHQSYMVQAAEEYPDVQFVSMTGDTAAVCGLDNMHNAFTKVYESRYVSGIVAGMKLAELIENNEVPATGIDADGNYKIGYVGAYPYAEVVSGYTAFYLGIKSVVENVAMEVTYTNSWFDIAAEGTAAESLMADGCVIIGQHADSTGAPAAVQAAQEKGTVAYSVGYNVDMLSVAPQAALTSATNNWAVYYEEAFKALMDGEDLAVDWSEGYETGAVAITELGESCAEGTQEAVDEAIAAIKDGSLQVFDASKWTVDGKNLTTYTFDSTIIDFSTGNVVYEGQKYEAIVDGAFVESNFRSAPYFDVRIDGITELN